MQARTGARDCVRQLAQLNVSVQRGAVSCPALYHQLCRQQTTESVVLSAHRQIYRYQSTDSSAAASVETALFDASAAFGSLPRSTSDIKRIWPSSYDVKYPPLDQIERDMQHINMMVTAGKLPVTHSLLVVELWAVYQRGPYAPMSPRVFNNIIYAYSKLNAHMLAIQLYLAFPTVKWRSMANEAIKRSALQMAHPDAYVEALQRQETSGKPPTRPDLEGLAVVCIRAREFSRALAVLKQLEQLPGDLSPRVYKEMVISAMAVGDCDRAARATLSLSKALFGQEKELATTIAEHLRVAAPGSRKSILEYKWPDWLAKCLRMPEKVIAMCIKLEDAESCLLGVQALHLLGMRLHKELADRVLDFAVQHGACLLAELAVADIYAAERNVSVTQMRSLARAYANGEDVQGAFRILQALDGVGSVRELDDTTWDSITHSIVCLNNRVFLAGRQLRTKAGAAAEAAESDAGTTTEQLSEVESEVTEEAEGASGSAAAASGEAPQSGELVADDVPNLSESSASARSLLGFGFTAGSAVEGYAGTASGSALDLLLPERRTNRWGLYYQAASMGLGIPEICLSFAANAAEDVAALGGRYAEELHSFHRREVALAHDAIASSSQNVRRTFSDFMSGERESKFGTVVRGRSIEEVLQSNIVACEDAETSKGAGDSRSRKGKIVNEVVNIILGALPRCRAGAFVAPTFQQIVTLYNMKPDVDTYAALMCTFVEPPFFNLPKTQIILSSMEEVNIKPNGRIYGLLASLLARMEKYDRSVKMLEQAVTEGHRPPAESFRSVIRCALIGLPPDSANAIVQDVLRLARACAMPLGRDFEAGYIARRWKTPGSEFGQS